MTYVYLIKYKVNYTDETKYKVFSTFKDANNFHRNYKHHLLEKCFYYTLWNISNGIRYAISKSRKT